jgi:hypothetical protein
MSRRRRPRRRPHYGPGFFTSIKREYLFWNRKAKRARRLAMKKR